MIYKYSFMQFEGIPKEHIERDLKREEAKGFYEIMQKVANNYEYESETKGFSAQTVYTIELAITSLEKYNQALTSITKIVGSFRPDLVPDIRRIFEDMQQPDNYEKEVAP